MLDKCECLEKDLSKSKMLSKSFEALQKHAINLEIDLQQCQEKIKNNKSFKENLSKEFRKEREQYFEIQDLKSQLQDKGIVISKPNIFSDSLERNDFSKSKSVTQNNVSNDFSKPVTAQTLPPNKKSILKNTNVLAPGMYKLYTEPTQARTSHLNAKTLNVNFVYATCGKCVLNDKHDMCVLKSVAKPLRKTVASESNQKPRNSIRKLYERISVPLCQILYCLLILLQLVKIVLFIIDSGNDQIAPILGYRDLVQGDVTIKRVYYVEGLNHNLFSVDQFSDADLEVAFLKSTCHIHDLKGDDLLAGSCGSDLYSITLQDINSPNLICLMAKATSSQAWLWHRRLSHQNFDTINLLSKNDIMVGLPKLKFIKDHLCSSCTKFLNQTLHAYFAAKGILHQMSVARTPEQNGAVKRRNRTFVEAARKMLSAAKVPPFFWLKQLPQHVLLKTVLL
nr:integrase, catalytic region, zinc finger, CCHC-type, peptidase aspartic, catalytic [Tanacetum cinerariifolium]